MTLSPGTRLGPYEVLAPLGAGGMGEVYRARDTKLHRDVALKVLPEMFALDSDRLARFQREAQVLASLNHPNIAQIYGLEESNGVCALVMELVEGPTLAEVIAGHPSSEVESLRSRPRDSEAQAIRGGGAPRKLEMNEALLIAKQIADALEAAHEHGIVHRDLKPTNIKVRDDGTVKVLDFGLAKALETNPVRSDLSHSPTMTSPAMTGMGVILGTAAYMAPEQARGKVVDKRADIWAFGAVVYEMMTGQRAFEGDDLSITLASVLKTDPDWNALPRTTPVALRRLLRRCLKKDPKERLQAIGDARIEIGELLSGATDPGTAARAMSPTVELSQRWVPWAVAWVLLVALAALSFVHFREVPPVATPETRLEITTLPTTEPTSLAISPDGQKIAFVAMSAGRSRLWLRFLNAVAARPLMATDGAIFPFWSPDSRSIGFFADNQLKRIDIAGGLPQTLAKAATPRGGAWNSGSTILFAPTGAGPLFRASLTGGEPAAVTRLSPKERSHNFPVFLPDGRHFLYYVLGSPEVRGVYIGQLDGTDTRRLFDADAAAVYAPSGHILFVRGETLFAERFDPVRAEPSGDPVVVAEQVTSTGTLAALSASATGPFVYRTGSATLGSPTGLRQLVWFDRSGKELGKVGDPSDGNSPALSPDGRRVAVSRTANGKGDIWLLELERGVLSRFTSDAGSNHFPIWSPDGARIAFNSNRKGALFDLYQKPTTAAGSDVLLSSGQQMNANATDWSLDGRFVLYRNDDPNGKVGFDVWALPIDGDRKPFPIVQTEFEERDGQFSPDGKWIAYQSNEAGRFEIYVQPFPGPGARVQISNAGGAQVRWRRDGKELFYIALDGRLMAVPVKLASNAQPVEVSAPVPLFATHVGGAVRANNRQQYMVSPDGQRFLMYTVTDEAAAPITVVLNWAAGLKK